MHQVSRFSVQAAERHALLAQKHGTSIEACGKALQESNNQAFKECGKAIAECSHFIQEYAQQSLMYAQLLQTPAFRSTELYGYAVQAHLNAAQKHAEAVAIYTQVLQEKLKSCKKRLELNRSQQ